MMAENKLGPKPHIEKNDSLSNKTFRFKIVDIYNRIDRKLMLLANSLKFKKCLTKFTINPQVKFIISSQTDYKDEPPNLAYACDFSCS